MSNQSGASIPDADRVAALLRGRRTLGRFADKPVDRALLLEAIEVARWAPNHHLTEPWHFYVLGPEAISTTIECVRARATEAKGEEMGRRKAKRAQNVPAWVVVTSRFSDNAIVEKEDYAATCCAIHNMALYLWELGVGMKWCTGSMAHGTQYAEALGLDVEAEYIVGILRIGYPLNQPTQKRKAAIDITTIMD
ncbi:MAG: nitroreductase [Pseudomonadota bacterium]